MEGKITGLATYGKSKLKDQVHSHFFFDGDGLINSDFTNATVIRKWIMESCTSVTRGDASASI